MSRLHRPPVETASRTFAWRAPSDETTSLPISEPCRGRGQPPCEHDHAPARRQWCAPLNQAGASYQERTGSHGQSSSSTVARAPASSRQHSKDDPSAIDADSEPTTPFVGAGRCCRAVRATSQRSRRRVEPQASFRAFIERLRQVGAGDEADHPSGLCGHLLEHLRRGVA